MRRKPRQYKAHKCPGCQQYTTAKCYCAPCLATLRQPPMAARASAPWPEWREKSENGGRFYAA